MTLKSIVAHEQKMLTQEQEIMQIMGTPEAFESFEAHGFGMTFYDYVKMIVTEYRKIAINTYA